MRELTGPAQLLVDFANTYEAEDDVEGLDTPAALRSWLAERGLLPRTGRVTAADVELAQELRNSLRRALAVHHDDVAAADTGLDAVASRFSLRLTYSEPEPRLVPTGDGVMRALGELLVAMQRSAADGTWERLKLCRSDTCQFAFFDSSKNHRRSWCSMAVCGNREKTKAYRARRRSG